MSKKKTKSETAPEAEPMYRVPAGYGGFADVAASESARYALEAIALHPSGVAVCTDGKRLIVGKVEAAPGAVEVLVPREAWMRGLEQPTSNLLCADCGDGVESYGEKVVSLDVSLQGDELRLDGAIVELVNPVEGKSPPWRDVIPSPDKIKYAFCCDTKLLIGLLQAIPDDDDGHPRVFIGFAEPGVSRTPMAVWSTDHKVLGVLMPCAHNVSAGADSYRETRKELVGE